MTARLVAAAVALAVCAGCAGSTPGAGGSLQPPGSATPNETASAGGSTGAAPSTPGSADPSGSASAAPRAVPSRNRRVPLSVAIRPSCASPGAAMHARIVTTPGASVAVAVSYADDQTYGQYGIYPADDAGVLVYPWAVPPQAPAGRAELLVGVQGRDGQTGDIFPFEVRAVGGC